MTRVTIRIWRAGALQLEETLDLANTDDELTRLAERHMRVIDPLEPHLIEFEFLDAPANERFFRFGTDPKRMVYPIPIEPHSRRN